MMDLDKLESALSRGLAYTLELEELPPMMCRLAANHVTELVEHGSHLVSLPDALGVPATEDYGRRLGYLWIDTMQEHGIAPEQYGLLA